MRFQNDGRKYCPFLSLCQGIRGRTSRFTETKQVSPLRNICIIGPPLAKSLEKEKPLMNRKWQTMLLTLVVVASGSVAQAQNVKITPIGQRTGDFCALDRGLLFEDPTGVRILYDPGNTIAGATDPRLGDVHAIFLTHAHGDHLGAVRLNQNPDATTAVCAGNFPSVSTPNGIQAHTDLQAK
jgi:Metallo-beta-lactamase superfamily